MFSSQNDSEPEPGSLLWYSYPVTFSLFALGGLITAAFSGSLFYLASGVTFAEVLLVGMVVPSFTWVVQMTTAQAWLPPALRRLYFGDLARVCVWGSLALLPAAAYNLAISDPWPVASLLNVLTSVALMGYLLFRRALHHNISLIWPFSWCLTITINMTLFLLSSRHWW